MVPRAYSFSSGQQGRNGPPNSTRKAGTRPSEPRPTAKRTPTTSTSKLTTISPAAPSKPVVIPTRTKNDRRYSKARADAERASKDHGSPHDSEAVSPSVAAFLAIRPSSNSKQRSHTAKRHGQAVQDGFLQEASYNNLGGPSLSDLSPHSWRLLLSPPHDVEDEASSVGSGTTALVLRSFSSESMPSLDTDTESVYTSSSPSTPGLPRKGHRSQEKTSKSISSSVPEDCLSDHPLLPIQPEPENTTDADPTEGRLPGPTKLSFRSNLTASFRRLKSAAKTFSNIASPSTSRDESPTRASLSEFSKIASERRPLPWAEPPDPALRRYLNPFTVSPVELHTHRNHEESNRKPNYKASIQMQTYRPGPRKSDKASAPPVFAVPASQGDAADEPAISSASTPRQREPRENSDFLRVIVLEMNMRKVGKLSDVSPGRARLWLPARQPSAQAEEIKNETPRRWVSLSA
ncbi:MAG: hypothetical protein LQ350_006046 [Teloschistes chrysophthalmus]|nr:MAG: hypothetical protein LQ350_006046 [Niorma chrysophthalma]